MEFGQVYYIDYLKRIPMQFILYFSEVYSIFYEFRILKEFPGIKLENDFRKLDKGRTVLGRRVAQGRSLLDWPNGQNGRAGPGQ
jgi:hypothetical protein